MPYNFGEKSVSSLKGKKPNVKLLFGENCMILKKFSEAFGDGAHKQPQL
jgi:hypothetical protein